MAKRSNDEAGIEREKAYRRGYAYGIQAMMSVFMSDSLAMHRLRYTHT